MAVNLHVFSVATQTFLLVAFFNLSGATHRHAVASNVRIDVVAATGDYIPDGTKPFVDFRESTINDAGQVAFRARYSGDSGGVGIYRGNSNGEVIKIAQTADTLPTGDGEFIGFSNPALNSLGHVQFSGAIKSDYVYDDYAIFSTDKTDRTFQVVRKLDYLDDGIARLYELGVSPFNNVGQTAFVSGLYPNSEGSGIFRSDGENGPVQIVREGDAAPDGVGTFGDFMPSQQLNLNDAGQVAFVNRLDGAGGEFSNYYGIFLSDGTDTPSQIARTGQTAPDGNGVFFDPFYHISLNNQDQVAFTSWLANTIGGHRDNTGIYLSDGDGPPVQIAREGLPTPGGDDLFSEFTGLALNNVGQVAFKSADGLFVGDSPNNLVRFVRDGDVPPNGIGDFTNFFYPILNDMGQVAFVGTISGGSPPHGDNLGLFIYDEFLGLTQMARSGDSLLGSSIINIFFHDQYETGKGERHGFNNHGQVAFVFELADGRQGVAIATIVPEPPPIFLTIACLATLLIWRTSRPALLASREKQRA